MRLALGLLFGAMAFAQNFRDLATTDDGSRLYFSWGDAGIFVYDGQGVRLFAQDASAMLGWPSVSGDGRIIGFSALTGGKLDARLAWNDGTVIWSYTGQAAVSRNARFALFVTAGPEPRAAVVDLAGGPGYSALLPSATAARSIASDGTFVAAGPNAVRVVRAGGTDIYDAPDRPAGAVVDDKATAVAYVAGGNLLLLDLSNGVETPLAGHASGPSFTRDGQRLLYTAPDANGVPQAWMTSRTAAAEQLTREESGIVEGVISGDGSTAYAITGSMRVLRIDTASRAVRDLTTAILTASQAPRVGVATASATVEEAPARIVSFRNDPSFSPVSGGPVTLSWTTENAQLVRMTGLGTPSGSLPPNGSVVVRPDTNTSYTLFAYGSNGQVVSSVLYVFVR